MLFLNKKRLGSKFWIESENMSFSEITENSFILKEWAMFNKINKYGYTDSNILIPANPYVINFCQKPIVKKISKDEIVITQKTHAEIWIEQIKDNLYALDKCWQRQFYPSANNYSDFTSNYFPQIYKFYMPWIINKDIEVEIIPTGETFFSFNQKINFKKNNMESDYSDVPFIDFVFKKDGPHMRSSLYGIVDIGTEMYDMIIRDNEVFDLILKELS